MKDEIHMDLGPDPLFNFPSPQVKRNEVEHDSAMGLPFGRLRPFAPEPVRKKR